MYIYTDSVCQDMNECHYYLKVWIKEGKNNKEDYAEMIAWATGRMEEGAEAIISAQKHVDDKKKRKPESGSNSAMKNKRSRKATKSVTV